VSPSPRGQRSPEIEGYALGALAVALFSLTVPMTRLAVPDFGATIVGLGRGLAAGLIAAAVLMIRREPIPPRRYWPVFLRVALGVTIGFPILTSLALAHLPAAHGAVVTGLQPAGTAVFAALRAAERPPRAFWLAVLSGVVTVLVFASVQGAGRPQLADLLLLLAMVASSFGHVEAARIARDLGGWRVISWTLVVAAPILALPVGVAVARRGLHGDAASWLALAELTLFSAYLGFFPWYRGMTLAGIARVGQLQLAQPVLSLLWSALLLHEHVGPGTVLAALAVVASVALTRRTWTPVAPAGVPSPRTPPVTPGP
jgi:drug/metabolite transporter (DMT)-like permease